jgi:hypothetical protein
MSGRFPTRISTAPRKRSTVQESGARRRASFAQIGRLLAVFAQHGLAGRAEPPAILLKATQDSEVVAKNLLAVFHGVVATSLLVVSRATAAGGRRRRNASILCERRNGCTGDQAYYKTQSKHSVSSALSVGRIDEHTLTDNLSRTRPAKKRQRAFVHGSIAGVFQNLAALV